MLRRAWLVTLVWSLLLCSLWSWAEISNTLSIRARDKAEAAAREALVTPADRALWASLAVEPAYSQPVTWWSMNSDVAVTVIAPWLIVAIVFTGLRYILWERNSPTP